MFLSYAASSVERVCGQCWWLPWGEKRHRKKNFVFFSSPSARGVLIHTPCTKNTGVFLHQSGFLQPVEDKTKSPHFICMYTVYEHPIVFPQFPSHWDGSDNTWESIYLFQNRCFHAIGEYPFEAKEKFFYLHECTRGHAVNNERNVLGILFVDVKDGKRVVLLLPSFVLVVCCSAVVLFFHSWSYLLIVSDGLI